MRVSRTATRQIAKPAPVTTLKAGQVRPSKSTLQQPVLPCCQLASHIVVRAKDPPIPVNRCRLHGRAQHLVLDGSLPGGHEPGDLQQLRLPSLMPGVWPEVRLGLHQLGSHQSQPRETLLLTSRCSTDSQVHAARAWVPQLMLDGIRQRALQFAAPDSLPTRSFCGECSPWPHTAGT